MGSFLWKKTELTQEESKMRLLLNKKIQKKWAPPGIEPGAHAP